MTEVDPQPIAFCWPSQITEESPRQLACYQCRRRKVKCDKHKPACRSCVQNHQNCKYPTSVDRPGPKQGSKFAIEPKDGILARHRTVRRTSETAVVTKNAQRHENESGNHLELLSLQGGSVDKRGSAEVLIAPSWILHDFHEVQSYQIVNENGTLTPAASPENHAIPRTIQSNNAAYICQVLEISQLTLTQFFNAYFDNMTTLILFRQPTMQTYLYSTLTPEQAAMLAAAMFSFSARFVKPIAKAQHYMEKASDLIHVCLRELGNEVPPLCLLQALILVTYYEMVNAARGKAWRLLGTCIRLAYELRLHEIDAPKTQLPKQGTAKTDQWILDEERRRVWWALWELDVFISTVKMLPVSIADGHNATLLPVEDEAWFNGQSRQSCFLESDPVTRWKHLEQSGNKSGNAWFIVLNSFARDIHALSHPTFPVTKLPNEHDSQGCKLVAKMCTLANCVSCFVLALPETLSYERFSAANNLGWRSRKLMSDQHLIHVMLQLTKLYIYHHECFNKDSHTRAAERVINQPVSSSATKSSNARNTPTHLGSTTAWRGYLDAADQVVQVIRTSHTDHIRYGNPLLANTYWMVAAIQLLRKTFAVSEEETQLALSNFDLMKLTLLRYQKFWDVPSTSIINLTALSLRFDPLSTRLQAGIEQVESTSTAAGLEHRSRATNIVRDLPVIEETDTTAQDSAASAQSVYEFASHAIENLPSVEDTMEFLDGGASMSAMDNEGFQVWIDSVLADKSTSRNSWNDWNENMELGSSHGWY